MLRTLDLEASSEDDAGKRAHDAGKTSQTHDVFDDVDKRVFSQLLAAPSCAQVLGLLAVLVQKYKY